MITRKHSENHCFSFGRFLNSKKSDGYLVRKISFFYDKLIDTKNRCIIYKIKRQIKHQLKQRVHKAYVPKAQQGNLLQHQTKQFQLFWIFYHIQKDLVPCLFSFSSHHHSKNKQLCFNIFGA